MRIVARKRWLVVGRMICMKFRRGLVLLSYDFFVIFVDVGERSGFLRVKEGRGWVIHVMLSDFYCKKLLFL